MMIICILTSNRSFPTIIALPFKLLLFVLVDGWALTMGSLAQSFG